MISCFNANFEVRCDSHKGSSFIVDFNLSLPSFPTDMQYLVHKVRVPIIWSLMWKDKIWNEFLFIIIHSKIKQWYYHIFFVISLYQRITKNLHSRTKKNITSKNVEEEFEFCDEHCTSKQYSFCLTVGNEDEPFIFGSIFLLIYQESS
jgi:hypothetical protein